MKKVLIIFALAIIAIGISSCDDSVLSTSSAKRALKKEAIFAKDYATVVFKTGYYEVDAAELTALNQLVAAGMITLSADTIIEKAEKRSYDYWTGYRYYTSDVEHIFANVALTEKGKTHVVDEPTTMRKDIINDLKANDNYIEEVPDYMKLDEQTEIVEEETTDNIESIEASFTTVNDTIAPNHNTTANQATQKEVVNPNAAYYQAIDKVAIEEHNMLLGHYSLKKVKEIRCSEEMAKNGVGECKAIITFCDKTPFGYILGAPQEGYLQTISVSFIYYQDLGWTVTKISD